MAPGRRLPLRSKTVGRHPSGVSRRRMSRSQLSNSGSGNVDIGGRIDRRAAGIRPGSGRSASAQLNPAHAGRQDILVRDPSALRNSQHLAVAVRPLLLAAIAPQRVANGFG